MAIIAVTTFVTLQPDLGPPRSGFLLLLTRRQTMSEQSYDLMPADRFSAWTNAGEITGIVLSRTAGCLSVRLDPQFAPLLQKPLKMSRVRLIPAMPK